jgi:hypothetical protein
MKKAFAGLLVLCAVIVTLLAVFNIDLLITSQVPNRHEIPAQPIENIPAEMNDRVGTPQAVETAIPDPALAILAEPPAAASNTPIIAAEELTTPAKDPEPIPENNMSPRPETESNSGQAGSQPTLNIPKSGLGLLTDTGETVENQILDPQSTQVQPTIAKKSKREVKGSPGESKTEKTVDLEIAILPEGHYPFFILLATFDKQTNAENAVALYRKQGLTTFRVKVNLGNSGVKYRLFTGMFSSEGSAQTFLTQHRITGKPIKNASYTAQIGVFHDKKELAKAFVKTAETGVFPYILATEKGPFFLYVGAFYTPGGAENQCRELVAKGLSCQAVCRSTLPPRKR